MLFDTWLESNRYMRKILLWYDWTTKQNFVCVIVNNLRIFTCIRFPPHKINKVEKKSEGCFFCVGKIEVDTHKSVAKARESERQIYSMFRVQARRKTWDEEDREIILCLGNQFNPLLRFSMRSPA